MGFGAVVLEGHLASRAFKRRLETEMLGRLAGVVFYVAVFWLVWRVGVEVISGDLALVASGRGVAFLIEVALHVWAIALLAPKAKRQSPARQFRAGLALVLAGTAYRLNVYLVAFRPGQNWSYFPAVPELLITLGIIALEIALYIAAVRTLPILSGEPAAGGGDARTSGGAVSMATR